MTVFLVFQAAELKLVGLCAALNGDVLRLALLVGDDGRHGGLAELQFRLHTEQLLCTCDKRAVEREADVTGFQQLDDFVFLALVFQVELVLVVESRLGVLVNVEVDLVADLGNHVELQIGVEHKVVVAFAALGHRGIVAEAVLEAEGEVDGALGTDVDGVAAEDGLKGLAANVERRDDGTAVGGRTCVLATAFLPVLLYAFFVLILKIFALRKSGGGIVVELADAALEGVLSGQRVIDDFGIEVVGVVEVERRLVVEVFQRVARVDRDGVDDLGRVGFHLIRVEEDVVYACRCRSGKKQHEQYRK